MKKILLIPIFLLLFSCTPDDSNCNEIDVKVYFEGEYYFKIKGEKVIVPYDVWTKYQMGDTYCQ